MRPLQVLLVRRRARGAVGGSRAHSNAPNHEPWLVRVSKSLVARSFALANWIRKFAGDELDAGVQESWGSDVSTTAGRLNLRRRSRGTLGGSAVRKDARTDVAILVTTAINPRSD